MIGNRADARAGSAHREWIAHVLKRKQLFVEKVVERVAPPFKAWSGGALATERTASSSGRCGAASTPT